MHLHVSADPTAPATVKLGEAVADSVLRVDAGPGGDASHLAACIRSPETYAVLMEFIHGRGGVLRHGRLRLLTQARSLTPVWEALPLMVDLARLLREEPGAAQADAEAVSRRQPVRQASPAG